jgi:hypothetical protein
MHSPLNLCSCVIRSAELERSKGSRRMRTLLVLVALVVATAPAGAAPITYEWSGTVSPAPGFPLIAPASTPVSFDLTYDLDQTNTCADGRGFFSIAGSMTLLGQSFNSVAGGIEVNNPLGNLCQTPISGFVPGTYSSYTFRLFLPGQLPLDYTQPGGAKIDLAFVVLLFEERFDGTLHALSEPPQAHVVGFGPFGSVQVFSGSASYRPVPEPTLPILLAIGAAGLGLRQATRTRRT